MALCLCEQVIVESDRGSHMSMHQVDASVCLRSGSVSTPSERHIHPRRHRRDRGLERRLDARNRSL
jgi:hypothetical protein